MVLSRMTEMRDGNVVAGEIAAAPRAGARPFARTEALPDIVDAEYETLPPRTRERGTAHAGARAAVAAARPGLDILCSRGGKDVRAPAHGGGVAFWVLVLLLAAGAFWISGGHAIPVFGPMG